MGQLLPERAVDNDFQAEAYDIDEYGIYKTIEYMRHDGTLYMRSTLSGNSGAGQYSTVTLSYYDVTGQVHLYDIKWALEYDLQSHVVSRKQVT
jgi:hypothetical protein